MQETKRSAFLDSLKIVGLAIMACYVCRFWPMVIFLIIYGLAVVARTLVKSRKTKSVQLAPFIPAEPIPSPTPTQRDLENLAFSMICQRITEMVARDYPNARWVWEFPTAQKLIMEGHEVYILLNRAGGYRRAQVLYQNLQVTGLKYESITGAPAEPVADPVPEESEPDNYSLLAFQWVDAHLADLSSRCDEARKNGLAHLLVSETELPVAQSWQDICTELARAGFKTKVLAEGIKIVIGDDKNEHRTE